MIPLKQRFIPMLRACKLRSIILCIFLGALTLVSTGCQGPPVAAYTLGEWFQRIQEHANLVAYERQPYFHHIDANNYYFDAVQALVDWQIVKQEDTIELENPLTKEWVAYTLVNLLEFETNTIDQEIKDVNQSRFPKQVSRAVSYGLFSLNQLNQFEPKEIIAKEDADALLEKVIKTINNRDFGTSQIQDIQWKDQDKIIELSPIEWNEDKILITHNPSLKTNQTITIDHALYKILEIEEGIPYDALRIEPTSIEESVDTIHLLNSFEVDFENAYIVEERDNKHSYIINENHHLMAYALPSHSFDFNGFQVQYQLTSAGFQCKVTKKMDHGTLEGIFNLNSIHPSYQLDYTKGNVESAYFKLAFQTSEKVGFHHSNYKTLYGDFSELDPKNLWNTIQSIFKNRNEIENIAIPICTIAIPIPEAPGLDLTLALQVKLGANGRAELVLNQQECFGMEVRNGHMRPFSDFDHSSKAEIQGDTSLLASIQFALNGFKQNLMDLSFEGGAKASFDTQVHLYEDDGKEVRNSDLPIDALDELGDGNGNFMACADVHAYWLLNALINSNQSLLGRHGFTHQFALLNEENASLFPGSKHIENGHFVPKCTRLQREKKKKKEETTLSTNQIQLEAYVIELNESEHKSIHILSLPKGYTKEDLQITSTKPNIVGVDGNGNLTALKEGNSIIQIQTNDGKYKQNCTVIVRIQKDK